MRGWRALLFALVPALLHAQGAATLHVERADPRSLARALVELAQQILEPGGLILDREHVSLGLSAALPVSGDVEVRAAWSGEAGIPALPLVFELRARTAASAQGFARVLRRPRIGAARGR